MPGTPSWLDLYNEGRIELLTKRPDLQALPGDITDMILAEGASMADVVAESIARSHAKRYLHTVVAAGSDDDVDELVFDRTLGRVIRHAASKATTTVKFTRATTAAGGGTLDAGFVVATARATDGSQYRYLLDAPLTFSASDTTKTGTATAEKTGAASNAKAGKVTQIVSSPFDSSLTVQSTEPAAGGADKESSDDLILRALDFPSTIEKGTLAALQTGALRVPGCRIATAYEDPTGLVTLYVADRDGNSSTPLVTAVRAELETGGTTGRGWRAAGSIVTVTGGIVLEIETQVELTVDSGFDVTARAADIISAITARGERYGAGATVDRDHIKTAVFNVDRKIKGVTVLLPAANIIPSANQVPRLTPVSVT